jgi:type I restriction enzyme S subunit
MVEQVHRLSDVIHLIGGGTPKRAISEYWNGEIPWLSVKDFNHGGRYVERSDETITKLGLEKSSTKLLKPGMLIISARGTVGELAQLKCEMAFNQSCYGIDAKTQFIDNEYLYYLLKVKIRELKSIAHGSVFDTITRETFENIEVGIPTKSDQKAIAHVLGALDDKIELNQKMSQTLEDIAKAIFKSWFVDFDPVRAKAEGRSTGLPAEIGDLFPDKLVDSKIGEIPAGWEVANLKAIGSNRSKSLKPNQMSDFRSYVGLEHLPRGRFFLSSSGNPDSVESNKTAYEQGDILFGKLRPYFEKCVIAPERGVCSTDIVVIKPDTSTQIFVLCLVSQKRFFEFTSQGSTGTRMPRTSWNHMCEYDFALPCPQTLEVFQSLAAPLIQRGMVGIAENEVLSELRDTLLPKLISGELRIPDAEKFLAEAGI